MIALIFVLPVLLGMRISAETLGEYFSERIQKAAIRRPGSSGALFFCLFFHRSARRQDRKGSCLPAGIESPKNLE
jgi:hypothetical protein